MPGSSFRFLGPSVRIAVPLAILWGTACSFLAALIVQSTRTLINTEMNDSYEKEDKVADDITILASVELSLSFLTLVAVMLLLRIDCKYDPDWSGPPVDAHGTGVGVSVIGGIGGFTLPTTTGSERVSRVAWVVWTWNIH